MNNTLIQFTWICIVWCSTALFLPGRLQAQFTASTTATLPGVLAGSVAWGDYDNDGDLDILLTGQDDLTNAIAGVYANTGGGVFTTAATLTGVANSAVAWGDYDNDGDLDILLTGEDNSATPVSIVYRNDSGVFTEAASLIGVYNGSVAWGDYDSDGDLDILLTGQTGVLSGIAHIYRNDGNSSFTQAITLPGVFGKSAAAWGDYNNDGLLDLVLAGQTGLLTRMGEIYRNNGDGTFTNTVSLAGVSLGSVAWGDYDNDGDPDILLTGTIDGLGLGSLSTVYRNDGNDSFTASVSLVGLLSGSAAWGDYDNDGDLDIVQTGLSLGLGSSSVYRNDGSDNFTVSASLTGVLMSSVAWGDHDNDGDLDILLIGDTGLNPQTLLYDNTSTTANTEPDAPGGLQVVFSGTGTTATLVWSRASDAETPQDGISYAVAIGTTTGGVQVKSPMADLQTGYRRTPSLGNVFQTTATVIRVIPGAAYYWSVQAVDGGLLGSAFSSGDFIAPSTTAVQLVITDISPFPPVSGEPFTIAVESRNSFDQPVAVTQAVVAGITFSNPYLTSGTGSTQATLQAGSSSTTITLAVNSASSASVTAVFTVSGGGLSSTNQSITINPDAAHIASQLVVTGVVPASPGSGEQVAVTVEVRNSVGQAVPATQASVISVSLSEPYLTLSGGTQAIVQVGESSTTLAFTLHSTSSATIGAQIGMSAPGLLSTSQVVIVQPLDSYRASAIAIADINPSAPASGEPVVISVQAINSFGQVVSVTQASTVSVAFSNPYLSQGAGSTQAVLQAGTNSTTLTFTINSTSSASVTTLLAITADGLASTSQSITVSPVSSFTVSHLAIINITPPVPTAGEPVAITVESRNSFGQAVPVTQSTVVGAALDHPYLSLAGGTQAVLQVGDNSTTLTLTINSTSSANVTALLAVSGGGLAATSHSITVSPDSNHAASYIVVAGVNPAAPGSGQSFTVALESRNTFGRPAPVQTSVTAGALFTHPYLTLSAGSTQATFQTGESTAHITMAVSNSSTASVTASFTIDAGGLASTTLSLTIGVDDRQRALDVAIMLEGPYVPGTEMMSTALRTQNLIPLEQPYNYAPFNYAGNESTQAVPPTAVDWVLIELRSAPDASSPVVRLAGFLRNDGALTDADGLAPAVPASVPDGNYYIVVYHRNHLPVMSANEVALAENGMAYDFSTDGGQAYYQFFDPVKQVDDGVFALYAGDTGQDGIINAVDRVDVRSNTGMTGYVASDATLDGIVNASDRAIVANNRFAVLQLP